MYLAHFGLHELPFGLTPDTAYTFRLVATDGITPSDPANFTVTVTNVVAEADVGAQFLYTDVWTSMGQQDSEERTEALRRYQINNDLVRMAADDVLVMHCLPAHRGEEITADVLDGPRSIAWDQAENRLFAQMALLDWLLSS